MYSELAQRMMADARFGGPLEGATQTGVAGTPGEGPYLLLWLDVADGRIVRAAYRTFGCPAAIACGSVTCGLVYGRTTEQAGRLTAPDLMKVIGGLPEGKEYCADLAIEALANALKETNGA